MTLNDYFDRIVVINLPSRSDRLSDFDAISKKYNFTYEVFEAFNGKEKINDNFEYNGVKVGHSYVNPNYFKGAVGCLISHLEVIKSCRDLGVESVLILEDDVGFCEDFENKFNKFINVIPTDWQFLYLSGSVPEFIDQYDGYATISKILTTHSYALKSEIYDILINYISGNMFTMPVDTIYTHIQNKLKTYVALPFLTFQKAGYSDIGDVYNDYESIRKYL